MGSVVLEVLVSGFDCNMSYEDCGMVGMVGMGGIGGGGGGFR